MHLVKCFYCQQQFDRDKIPFVQVNKRRYAHQTCAAAHESDQQQILSDEQKLDEYIMHLFNIPYIDARIRKQINTYIETYNYTYSGILKALIFHFDINGGSVEKANGGIGIVPYVYQQAYNYYYSLWLAQQKNEGKEINEYVPQIKIVTIPVPERHIKRRKLFSFLDEEEEN